MKYNPEIHHRRSIRLQGYDYSQAGAYFVTICTQNRECLFGDIVNGEMRLNEVGRVVESVWDGLPGHYAHVELDAMVIMPNHFHGVIVLTPVGAGDVGAGDVGAGGVRAGDVRAGDVRAGDVRAGDVRAGDVGAGDVGAGDVGAGLKPAPTPTAVRHGLSEIVRALKTFSSRRINELRQTPGSKLWQRNYWEHIVRNESELNRIREYILANPAHWELDKLHPDQSEFCMDCTAGSRTGRTQIREPSAQYAMEAWMV